MTCVPDFNRQKLEEFVHTWDTAFHRGEYEAMAVVYGDNALASDMGAIVGRPSRCSGGRPVRLRS